MRAEVPISLLPAHRRGVERGEEGGSGLRSRDGLEIVGEHESGCAVEVDGDVRHDGESGACLACRPARPPANVGLGRGPERREPEPQKLGLRIRGLQLRYATVQPALHRHPPVLAVDPGAARTAADEPALHRQLWEDARTDALRGFEPRPHAESQALCEHRDVLRDVGRECFASVLDGSQSGRRRPREPRRRPRRDAAVHNHLLEPAALPSSDRPRAGRIHDRDELTGHDEERAPHPEDSHERARLVELALDVGRDDVRRSGAHGQKDRDRIRRVQHDDRTRRLERILRAALRAQSVPLNEPRSSLGHVHPLHTTVLAA